MNRLVWTTMALLAALAMVGCGGEKEQYGDRPEDWKKTAPPPEYRGPGQPGGPPAGAATQPGVQPPANPAENLTPSGN
ncbi:MAG: hypothetical protein WHU10_04155 [Fimbriimonadales bacterium]